MINNLYIDNRDAYSDFGIFVSDGGYSGLVQFAPLKPIASISWPEEDGAQFDLKAPKLDSREFSMKFVFNGNYSGLESLVKLFAVEAYHWFDFRDLGRVMRLRMVGMSSLEMARKMGFVTINFADDFPLPENQDRLLARSIVENQGYALNGVDLSLYGVRVLKGSLADIIKSPAVKKNLTINISSKDGAVYDGKIVKFGTKDVNINCLMRAKTSFDFWSNHNAMLMALSCKDGLKLAVAATNQTYHCIYRSMQSGSLYTQPSFWWEFSLNLCFTLQKNEDIL